MPTETARPCASCYAHAQELTTTTTAQANRLRALLRDGGDHDRALARSRLNDTTLAALARRQSPAASRAQAVRHAEIRRLALALRDASRALTANRAELDTIVGDMAPGLTSRPGVGPVSAAQAIVSFSHPGRCRHDAAFARLAGWPSAAVKRPRVAGRRPLTGSLRPGPGCRELGAKNKGRAGSGLRVLPMWGPAP